MARRRFFRRTRRVGRAPRRVGRRTVRVLHRARGASHALFRGSPKWAKPSNFTVGTGVAVGTTTLIFKPLPNADSWVRRLVDGYSNYKASGNPVDILGTDPAGNNVTSILAAQLDQNAPGAIAQVAGYGIVGGVLRWFGM